MLIVTGGAGFIGSNIVAEAEARGLSPIIVCDRLRSGGKWRNVAKRLLEDVVPPEQLFSFLDRHAGTIHAVLHMGAITATTAIDADLAVETNVRLSQRLWAWCSDHQVPLIYASSAATYGDGRLGFDDNAAADALARLRPLNLYGWSKHVFDRWVIARCASGAPTPPRWAGLKYFNVYGPNEYHKGEQASVISKVFPDVAAGRVVRLFQSHRPDYADGGQLRDFVWVGDCADVTLWFLEDGAPSGLFNCGTGMARSFADLATAAFGAMNREPLIDYIPMPEAIRDQYQYFTEARLDRLRSAGYDRPFTSLEDGVRNYVRDYLDTADPYR